VGWTGFVLCWTAGAHVPCICKKPPVQLSRLWLLRLRVQAVAGPTARAACRSANQALAVVTLEPPRHPHSCLQASARPHASVGCWCACLSVAGSHPSCTALLLLMVGQHVLVLTGAVQGSECAVLLLRQHASRPFWAPKHGHLRDQVWWRSLVAKLGPVLALLPLFKCGIGIASEHTFAIHISWVLSDCLWGLMQAAMPTHALHP
jgi:hypothetical protein